MFREFLFVNRSFMTFAASAKLVSVGLLILLFMFLGINWLNCMQQESQCSEVVIPMQQLSLPGQPDMDNSFVPPRNQSAFRRFFKEISYQIGLETAVMKGETVHPGLAKINGHLEEYYDDYSGHKFLDLTANRTHIRLRWIDFAFLFNDILSFMNTHDVKWIDLCGNYLESNGIPALSTLAMLEDNSIAVIKLGDAQEIKMIRDYIESLRCEGKEIKSFVPACNPICLDPNLEERMKEFRAELNSSDGFFKKILRTVLGGLINFGQEEIDVYNVREVDSVSRKSVVLDFGTHQYTLKKILKNAPRSFAEKIAPVVSKIFIGILSIGLPWLITYYVKGLFDGEEACDIITLQQYLIDQCEFNSTIITHFFD